jgi:hypothetical protein
MKREVDPKEWGQIVGGILGVAIVVAVGLAVLFVVLRFIAWVLGATV